MRRYRAGQVLSPRRDCYVQSWSIRCCKDTSLRSQHSCTGLYYIYTHTKKMVSDGRRKSACAHSPRAKVARKLGVVGASWPKLGSHGCVFVDSHVVVLCWSKGGLGSAKVRSASSEGSRSSQGSSEVIPPLRSPERRSHNSSLGHGVQAWRPDRGAKYPKGDSGLQDELAG